MNLLRDMQRRVAGGTAAAVLVPVAIVVAAVALGTGGFGGLTSLGQAFNGPEIPGVEPASARADDAGDEDVPGELLADVDPAATATPAAARRSGTPGRRTPARRRGRKPGRNGNRPGASPTPRPTQPQPTPTSQPQPTPAPTEPPSTIRQVGDQVKQVTDPIPVAGEPAGQVVDTIVDTAEQLPLPKIPGVLP